MNYYIIIQLFDEMPLFSLDDSLLNIFSMGHPGYVSVRYYQGNYLVQTDTYNSGAFSVNGITYYPFPIHDSVGLSRLAIYCATSVSDGNARIGIYSNFKGLPKNLLVDAGNLPAATAGVKEAVISVVLEKGWYWFAGVTTKAPSVYSGVAFLGMNHILGQTSPASTNATCSLRNTGTYSSLPSIAPVDNLSLIAGNSMPFFWFKVA